MNLPYRTPSVLLAVTCLPLAMGAIDISFAPGVGTRWAKTFECSTEFEFDELSVVMGGQEIDSQYLPQIDLESRGSIRIEVIDELRGVGQGRPSLLHRTFESASSEALETMEMAGMDGNESSSSQGEGRSPLEGRTVAFEWSDDGEDFETSWVGRGADDDLLSGLDGDLDLIGWLPEGSIEVGDSWSLPASVIDSLESPGGELGIELKGENVEAFEQKGDDEGSYDGELELILREVREADGRRLAVVQIEGEATHERTYAGDLEDVPVADGTTTVTDETEFEFEGELIWDLRAGILQSLELSAETNISSHAIKDEGQPGPAFETIATLLGEIRYSVSVEEAD